MSDAECRLWSLANPVLLHVYGLELGRIKNGDRCLPYLCGYLLQHFLLCQWATGGGTFFLLVEAILCYVISDVPRFLYESSILQKLLRMRAALSLSMSRVVGQKASEPSLFESLFTGAPSLSTHP